MKIESVSKNKKNELVFKVDANEKQFNEAEAKAITSLASSVKIDGFRKGKVPSNLVKQKVDPKLILEKTINFLTNIVMNDLYKSKEFDKEKNKITTSMPSIEIREITKDNIVKFNICFEIFPSIDVADYKKIKIDNKKAIISEKEVNQEIDKELSKNAMTIKKENGKIEKGDIVTFDFKGFVDKKPLEGGEAKDYELEIGSNSFIPGFEDKMIGLKLGDEKDIVVTFPKDYHKKEIANKEAKFSLKINNISTLKKEELTDDFVKSLGIDKVNSVAEYKKHIKSDLEKKGEEDHKNKIHQEYFDKLLKAVKIEFIPEKLIQKQAEISADRMKEQLKMYGINDINDYLKMMQMNEEDFMKQQFEISKNQFIANLAISKIAELEKISVTKKEIEDRINELSKKYNLPVKELKDRLGNNISVIEDELIQEKVLDKMIK